MKNLRNYLTIVISVFLLNACTNDEESTMPDENATEEVSTTEDSDNGIQIKSIVDEIHRLVNEHRASLGLNTLEQNSNAELLAIEHTHYMIEVKEISHDNLGDRFDVLQVKENAKGVAENVAAFQRTAQSVVTAWLNSPGHKENIEGNYTFTGIAAIKDSNGRFYFTQLFYR